MESYSAIKNEDILSFAGKWMELENIILSEVTQTQNDMHGMHSVISACWQEPNIAASQEALSEPNKYRGDALSQPLDWAQGPQWRS